MADLSVKDFTKMFNVNRNGDFSTDVGKTHGQLTLRGGKLVNVNRYDRGRSMGVENTGLPTHENYQIRDALFKALKNEGASDQFLTEIKGALGLKDGGGETARPLSRMTVKQVLKDFMDHGKAVGTSDAEAVNALGAGNKANGSGRPVCYGNDPLCRPNGVMKEEDIPEGVFFGQTSDGNTCPIISTVNAWLASGGENARNVRQAMIIRSPEQDGGYFEFKPAKGDPIKVSVADCKKKPETFSLFERAAYLALTKLHPETFREEELGRGCFEEDVQDLFGVEKSDFADIEEGSVDLENEIVKALTGKPKRACVFQFVGSNYSHYVAAVDCKTDEDGKHLFGYVESLVSSTKKKPSITYVSFDNLRGHQVSVQGYNPYEHLK